MHRSCTGAAANGRHQCTTCRGPMGSHVAGSRRNTNSRYRRRWPMLSSGHVRVVGRLAHDERSLQHDLGVAGEPGGVEFAVLPPADRARRRCRPRACGVTEDARPAGVPTAGLESKASWVMVPTRQLYSAAGDPAISVPGGRGSRGPGRPDRHDRGTAPRRTGPRGRDQWPAAATANASFESKWWKNAPLVTPAVAHRSSTVVALRPLARMTCDTGIEQARPPRPGGRAAVGDRVARHSV